MSTSVEQEFRHLTTNDLMKACVGAMEACTAATQEMMKKAETAGFRAARVRLCPPGVRGFARSAVSAVRRS